MHGRKKSDFTNRSEAEKEALRQKVANYKQLAFVALGNRRAGADPNKSLQLAGQLLRVNPDVYTLWNHRKEVLLSTHGLSAENLCTDEGLKALEKELELAAECILKNPKSYGAWHHRRWLFEGAWKTVGESERRGELVGLLDKELGLCAQFLDADERNFHCWNYRRFVADLHPDRTAQAEFDYSTERIMRNFSNYSAFHHRTTYLPRVIAAQGGGGKDELELLRGELDMVQQSIFTEPDDQTAWWYLQYLMGWAGRMGPAVHHELLREQADAIRGLLEEADVERPYRWAVLALADILRRLGGEGENAEAIALYTKLMELDPDHRQRYESLLRRLGA